MKIESWTSWDKADALGGLKTMGGYPRLRTWDEYKLTWCEGEHDRLEALREEILQQGLRTSGEHHQNAENGAPVFSDGTAASFSMRAWGDLMAAIWHSETGEDCIYMDFYLSWGEE